MKSANFNGPVFTTVFKIFRYDLLKAVIFILIFTVAILYSHAESSKYYNNNQKKSGILTK